MAFLKRANGDTAGQIIELKQDRTVIGRSPEMPHRPRPQRREPPARRDPSQGRGLLPGRPPFAEQDQGQQHRGRPGHRSSARLGRPDQHLRRRVHLLPAAAEPEQAARRTPTMIVTEATARARRPPPAHARRLALQHDGQRRSSPRSSSRRSSRSPETSRASCEIDAVAPKILDSLMELFPQAERLFLMLHDPATKRLVRKAFKYRPEQRTSVPSRRPRRRGPDEHQPVDRQPRARPEEGGAAARTPATTRTCPTSASIADLKIRSVMCVPLLTPDNKALGHPPARHERPPASSTRTTSTSWRPSPARRRSAIQNASMHESLLERERLEPRPEARRAGAEAVPAAVGARRSRATSSSPTTTRPTRSGGDYYDFVPLPDRPPGHRAGRRLGQGGGGGTDDGQVLGRHALLHPDRERARRRPPPS